MREGEAEGVGGKKVATQGRQREIFAAASPGNGSLAVIVLFVALEGNQEQNQRWRRLL